MQYRSAVLLIDPDGGEPALAKLTELGFQAAIDGTLNTGDDEEPRGTDQVLIQIATELNALTFWDWVSEIITPFGASMWSIWEGTIADYDEYGPYGPPTGWRRDCGRCHRRRAVRRPAMGRSALAPHGLQLLRPGHR
jgi:hypothetical protein